MTTKWDCETTQRFIQLYKFHTCLWDFQSTDYKMKQKRDVACLAIAEEMDIPGFSVQGVKNKIKNLRSTYKQEIKKIQDSMKSGDGNLYISNIKWLKEMEEMILNDNEDINHQCVENVDQERGTIDCQVILRTQSPEYHEKLLTTNDCTTTSTKTVIKTETTPRAKKRPRDNIMVDIKTLNEENTAEETAFDAFGKSVAMQLKALSIENALLAQLRIQTILTEFGIEDHRQRTGAHPVKYEQDLSL